MNAIKLGSVVSMSETKSTIQDVIEMLRAKNGAQKTEEATNILESLLDDLSYTGGKR